MVSAVVISKVGGFLKKNWKLIGSLVAFFVVSGMAKRFIGRIGVLWSIGRAKNNIGNIDYDFIAMSIHAAMNKGLFNWGENENAIIALVNTLKSMDEFLTVCRKYALKYSEDLRVEIREHFNDRQYSKLLWK